MVFSILKLIAEQTNVTPELILTCVEAASGQKLGPQRATPWIRSYHASWIQPYPVGSVDIPSLKKGLRLPQPSHFLASACPAFSAVRPSSSCPSAESWYDRTVITGSFPNDAWPEEAAKSAAPSPLPPAANRRPTSPTTPCPAFSATVSYLFVSTPYYSRANSSLF